MGLPNKDKTHCPQGHEYTKENTRLSKKNIRSCRACDRERAAKKRVGTESEAFRKRKELAAKGMKTCCKCKQDLKYSKFPKYHRTTDGRSSVCTACRKKYYVQYREKNKDKMNAESRARSILRKWGMTPDEYDGMLESQGYRCLICKNAFNNDYHLDHCHETDVIRGFLCSRCNIGLGYFQDNPVSLRNAATYIEESRERSAHAS